MDLDDDLCFGQICSSKKVQIEHSDIKMLFLRFQNEFSKELKANNLQNFPTHGFQWKTFLPKNFQLSSARTIT